MKIGRSMIILKQEGKIRKETSGNIRKACLMSQHQSTAECLKAPTLLLAEFVKLHFVSIFPN